MDEQELNYLMEAFYIPVSVSLFQYKLILHSFHTHTATQPSEQVNYTVLSYLKKEQLAWYWNFTLLLRTTMLMDALVTFPHPWNSQLKTYVHSMYNTYYAVIQPKAAIQTPGNQRDSNQQN